jgi:hypothetical protein
LNGDDLRRDPLEVRKAALASIVAKAGPGIRFNEHMEGDGPTVFAHACRLGLETKNGTLFFNPGSAGPRRFRLPVTVGRMTAEHGKLRAEIVELSVER